MWLSCTLAPNGPSQWVELPPCCLYQGQVCACERVWVLCVFVGLAALWIVCILCLHVCSLAKTSHACVCTHVRLQRILVEFHFQLWFSYLCTFNFLIVWCIIVLLFCVHMNVCTQPPFMAICPIGVELFQFWSMVDQQTNVGMPRSCR